VRAEVRAAMAEAIDACVEMSELQAAASRVIARHTGAQAGLVTSGAAAGLLLGTAACVARLDPARMARLPDVGGAPAEIVMVRSQRNQYDHALRGTGARIVEVGLPDRYAGAGCRDAEAWEIDAAIGERTVLVHWVADAQSRPPLEAVLGVARRHGLPVLVDAAAQLPPEGNLRRFVDAGADLVAFSGGKALGGPQASGILCGRAELVASAALQMLDMDYPEGFFRPPADFIDADELAGLPPHGIGRPCKVGKEQIVGLLTALELFCAESDAARTARWRAPLEAIAAGLAGVADLAASIREGEVPLLVLEPRGGASAARRLYGELVTGAPAIHTDPEELHVGRLLVNPLGLREGDVERILARLSPSRS
jgi:L-seryl-tRNA(Ser) seleniumtransferase